MEKPIYDFKKGDFDYDVKRKHYLIDLTKYKYFLQNISFK